MYSVTHRFHHCGIARPCSRRLSLRKCVFPLTRVLVRSCGIEGHLKLHAGTLDAVVDAVAFEALNNLFEFGGLLIYVLYTQV